MKLTLKPEIAAVLGPTAGDVADALDELAGLRLSPRVHFRVTQLENAMCERPSNDLQDEP